MLEAVSAIVSSVIASPWGYLAIFLVVAVDGFFPVMPGEIVLITAGVLAASGEQSLLAVMAVAAVGALAGDHVSYAIGRSAGQRAAQRLLRGGRGRAALSWAGRALHQRGGLVIVAFRFVAGGRTATTLMAGTVCYPLPRFTPFDAVAAVLWTLYAGLLGYWAGRVFEGRPLIGLLVGLGISLAVMVLGEAVRLWLRQARGAGASSAERPRG